MIEIFTCVTAFTITLGAGHAYGRPIPKQLDPILNNIGPPYYNETVDRISTSQQCSDRSSTATNCNFEWIVLTKGERPKIVREGESISESVNSSSVKSSTSECVSNLTLLVRANTSEESLPAFQCRLRSNSQEATSYSVQPKLSVVITPGKANISAKSGGDVLIRCPIRNSLPPAALDHMHTHWWRLNGTQAHTIFNEQKPTLKIKNITKNDEGWYECRPIGDQKYNTETPGKSSLVQVKVTEENRFLEPDIPGNDSLAPNSTSSTDVWDPPEATTIVPEIVNCSFIGVPSCNKKDAYPQYFKIFGGATAFGLLAVVGWFLSHSCRGGDAIQCRRRRHRHRRSGSKETERQPRESQSPPQAKLEEIASDVKETKSLVMEFAECVTNNKANKARNAGTGEPTAYEHTVQSEPQQSDKKHDSAEMEKKESLV